MLENVNDDIAEEHEHRSGFGEGETFRNHFQKHGAQHETRSQCDEVSQRLPRPFVGDDNEASEDVGNCCDKRGDNGLQERRHPLCRIVMMSPSFTAYSFPSSRSSPFSLSACIEPYFTKSSSWQTSARIK